MDDEMKHTVLGVESLHDGFSDDVVKRALQFLFAVTMPDGVDRDVYGKDVNERILWLLQEGDHDMTLEMAQVMREWAGSI